jgi:hypothetical protein
MTLVRAPARCHSSANDDPTTIAVLTGCKAQRIEFLEDQDREITAQLDTLVTAMNPDLRAAHGDGPNTAAQLIITAGTTHTDCATRPPSPDSAASRPSSHRRDVSRERPTAPGYLAVETAQPTTRSTASP